MEWVGYGYEAWERVCVLKNLFMMGNRVGKEPTGILKMRYLKDRTNNGKKLIDSSFYF